MVKDMAPNRFEISFNVEKLHELDQFALLARQDYNLGGKNDWFGCFRGGLYCMYSRLLGVAQNYSMIHSWIPKVRPPSDTECLLT
jgi:hypothetical protein